MKYLLIIILSLASLQMTSAQITPAKEAPQMTSEQLDAKYLVPLPEENGKVYMLREVQLPAGMSQEEAFGKMQSWMDRCLKDKAIVGHIDIPTEQPQSIQNQVRHMLTFKSNMFVLDQTEMTYVLSLSLQGDKMVLKMSHISFLYNGENRDRKMIRYTAEEHIADRVALNKKKTKLVIGYRKFRTKSVDLMDEYATSLKQAFWID